MVLTPPGRQSTILVIDDDESIRYLLRLHLTNAGYGVAMAEDAVEGGKSIINNAPDLVLLDVEMPYMTGLELLRAINEDVTLPRFPVVLLTAHRDGHDLAEKLGAAGFLAKPIFLQELLEEVARHLPSGTVSAAARAVSIK